MRDSSWELIELTIDKTSADCLNGVHALGSVYIAVQRRRSSMRIDHICDIVVVYVGENVPESYEVIEKSISGEGFFENGSSIPRTRLAVRRADGSKSMIIKGMPLIDDIVVINRSLKEYEPEDYVIIDRCLQQPKTWGGDSMILAYHKREALGLCDLKYESATLDRFPQQVSLLLRRFVFNLLLWSSMYIYIYAYMNVNNIPYIYSIVCIIMLGSQWPCSSCG